ncbi:hypothetical protein H8D30_02140 [bacterium]|nr:hypothetical protein [bacterium]
MSGAFIPEAVDYPKDAPKGFCFGAFALPLFWGVAHEAWIGVGVVLVAFVPTVGSIASLVGMIYMGIKGHEMGWEHHKSRGGDSASYHQRESVWRTWGIVGFIIQVIGTVVMIVEQRLLSLLRAWNKGSTRNFCNA